MLSYKSKVSGLLDSQVSSYKSTNQFSGLQTRGQENFTVKGQVVNILGIIMGRAVSPPATQFCY